MVDFHKTFQRLNSQQQQESKAGLKWVPITMFVNDILSIVSSPVFMFANDTKILSIIRYIDDYLAIQNDLNSLHKWSLTWQLTFVTGPANIGHVGT